MDKGHLCTQWVKWIRSHLSKPVFALISWDPWEGRSLAEIISRMVIFTSGAAHSFLLCKCITFAYNKSYCQEPGHPLFPLSLRISPGREDSRRLREARCNVQFPNKLAVEVSMLPGVTA